MDYTVRKIDVGRGVGWLIGKHYARVKPAVVTDMFGLFDVVNTLCGVC